ncbi:DUF6526 family protein [Pedobacter deserti]|uniref:DUF6526 family protein n=1 Tax=Pedobacter deserti TaxID=2817382 RepID=UPI00210A822B|nr:DUF6526 family protein [Pedobacter sp. SYSU D00382]
MQDYKNHIRFYAPHHFVFYPVILGAVIFSAIQAASDERNRLLWVLVAICFAVIGWLSFLLRQHYALTLQNRLVVTEMRFRYYVLTQQRLEELEDRLSFGQIAALRFASDAELTGLVEATLSDNLRPDDIKRRIKVWLPDHNRV